METMEKRSRAEIAQKMDERPDLVQRLRDGDDAALEDLLEHCTGAEVKSVTIRTLV